MAYTDRNLLYPKLDEDQRERAAGLEAQCADDPEAAAFEIIWLRDALKEALKKGPGSFGF